MSSQDIGKDHTNFHRFNFPQQLSDIVQRSKSGRILLARDFGLPSGLTSGQSIVLAVDQCISCRESTLNRHRIHFAVGDDGVGHCEIAEHLQSRNQLRILCEFPQSPTGGALSLREVRLEIIEPS